MACDSKNNFQGGSLKKPLFAELITATFSMGHSGRSCASSQAIRNIPIVDLCLQKSKFGETEASPKRLETYESEQLKPYSYIFFF